jgi:hypothetical protein
MSLLSTTRPDWYDKLPVEQQGLWSLGDSRFYITAQTSYQGRVRIVLQDGTILDGTMSDERNRWDPNKHAIAIRMTGRKTQKWIPRNSIALIWADKGRPFTELLTKFLETHH